MRKIVLASRNRKKAGELQEILAGLPYRVVSLEEYPDCPEIVEDGDTFEANSEKKAREVSEFTGEWTVADDSGLVVDALEGEPGVYSARYGGRSTDTERNHLLLEKLKDVSREFRTARFVCCATLFGEGRTLCQATGTCEGRILSSPRGDNGFGYDPVFWPAGRDRSMAELTSQEKHRISHRGKALGRIRDFLLQIREDKGIAGA